MGARRSGVRWRGSNTWAPGSGPRIAFSKNLRGQGSGLSTCQAEGGPHAPEDDVERDVGLYHDVYYYREDDRGLGGFIVDMAFISRVAHECT